LEQTTLEDPEALNVELFSYIDFIKNPQLKNTVLSVLPEVGKSFFISVTAKAMHHAHKSRLLEHTVHGTRAGVALLKFYLDIPCNLAIASMILHDVGKVDEYSGDRAVSRTNNGNLQGHIILGYRIVRCTGSKNELDPVLLERLEHIVLGHQGQLEFGAALLLASPDVIFVSLFHNLDVKIGMISHLLTPTPETQIFSEGFPRFETQILVEKSLNPCLENGVPLSLSRPNLFSCAP
jgi:3'-5' exoribonuclease